MKKCRKSGFTLIEAILAVAIIGTIAALVIPPLMSGAQNKKHATALGRSVEIVETGCQNLVQDMNEKADNLGFGAFEGHRLIHKNMDGTSAYGSVSTNSIIADSKLFDYAAEYFNVTPIPSDELSNYISTIRAFNGENPTPSVESIATNFAKNPKWGAYFGVRYITGEESQHNITKNEVIYIDVNGETSPNRYGRDIFLFELTDDCHMIPAGLAEINDIPKESIGCNGHNVTNGLSCTSRVIKDGYKIEYMK